MAHRPRRAAAAAAFYYDGSSTESEPFDEQERRAAAAPAPGGEAKRELQAEAAAVEVAEAEDAEPLVKPEDAHNVLDLLPPAVSSSDESEDGNDVEEEDDDDEGNVVEMDEMDEEADGDDERSEDGDAGVEGEEVEEEEAATTGESLPVTCGKCNKAMLNEVAALMKRLPDEEALRCHCCGLTVPAYCFTKMQKESKQPVCRGCRGVSTIVATLTTRTKKLVADLDGGGAPKPKRKPKTEKCTVCKLPITALLPGHIRVKEKLKCSCCDRDLPINGTFYSHNQRAKSELRRCKGCLGQVGKPTNEKRNAGNEAWREKHAEVMKARSMMKKKNKQEAKENAKRAKKEMKNDIFRNRVARYRFAVRALARKRAENDLRGSTRIEYMKELAKEEAALEHMAALLKKQNLKVFREVMNSKVKRAKDGEKQTRKRKRKNNDDQGNGSKRQKENESENPQAAAATPVATEIAPAIDLTQA